jgi:hemoglobin
VVVDDERTHDMSEVTLPDGLVEARRTPVFDHGSIPEPLAASHRTTVWATLHVLAGNVRYTDLEGEAPRDVRVEPGDRVVIAPHVTHHVDPSTDARFFVQFYREPDAPLVPRRSPEPVDSVRRSGPWEHRGRDVDSPEEVIELVTRQYVDVVQDDLLGPYFGFGPGFTDWDAHIGNVADYWNHVLLFAPDYSIDAIERHRPIHERSAFTPALFDRWLQIFHDTVDGGWAGPHAERAKKRATGTAWAMAQRLLGKGVWQPPERR